MGKIRDFPQPKQTCFSIFKSLKLQEPDLQTSSHIKYFTVPDSVGRQLHPFQLQDSSTREYQEKIYWQRSEIERRQEKLRSRKNRTGIKSRSSRKNSDRSTCRHLGKKNLPGSIKLKLRLIVGATPCVHTRPVQSKGGSLGSQGD